MVTVFTSTPLHWRPPSRLPAKLYRVLRQRLGGGGERQHWLYPVASLGEEGLMPRGVLHASPVSGTPPHKSHREFLHGGLVDNRLPLGIQPRAQQPREGLEIKCNGDGNKPGKTVSPGWCGASLWVGGSLSPGQGCWAGGREGGGRASWTLLRKQSTGTLHDVAKRSFLSNQTFFSPRRLFHLFKMKPVHAPGDKIKWKRR